MPLGFQTKLEEKLVSLMRREGSAHRDAPIFQLGEVQFAVFSLPVSKISVDRDYRYITTESATGDIWKRFLGVGETTIEISGRIIAATLADQENGIASLAAAASKGDPIPLMDSEGNARGKWIITRLRHDEMRLKLGKNAAGDAIVAPQEFDFSLRMERYDG